VFDYDLLLEAYRNANGEFTDDASVVEAAGHPVRVFWGSYDNLKVTTPEDLVMVDQIIGASAV
jgi:2-C-methyl-D-erythritol 4-phosphate cytidylyltransferase